MTLAIHGGKPVRTKPFPAHRTIGVEEKEAVNRVLDSGILSQYLGCWHEDFLGGPEVRALEKEWAAHFGVKHAMAVNSCTSGLYCAVGAVGTEPGEEIIVSPYTMSASATAPLPYGAVPIFADIEEDCFCLDPASVEKRITERTRAIIVVDIFGQPFDAEAIYSIAEKHGLYVIEDAAQAPYARYGERFAGALGHIGVYSFNYHKHIHCGEGGIVVTDDDDLAERVRLIRNHAEAVVEAMGRTDLVNMVGFNYRLPEMEAAIVRSQLKKLPRLVEERQDNCAYLAKRLGEIPALTPPATRAGCTHAYYVQSFKFDMHVAGVGRDPFIQAVKAELPVTETRESHGPLIFTGYIKPLYLQPMYQQQTAFGSHGHPFTAPLYKGKPDYRKGLCPVVERMHEQELFYHELMTPGMGREDLDDVVRAFEKVWEHRERLHKA